MSEVAFVNIRVEGKLKEQTEKIFSDLGLNMSVAVNAFLRQVIRQRGMPFELTLRGTPNAETLAAIQEMRDMESGKVPENTVDSVEELFQKAGVGKQDVGDSLYGQIQKGPEAM